MLIIALEGGLGNQMFQYAFYTALKEHYSTIEVKMDKSFVDSKKHNGFELQKVFNVEPNFCKSREVVLLVEDCPKNIPFSKIYNVWFAIRRRVVGRRESFVLQVDATQYYDRIFNLDTKKKYYFKGVWANYKYFDKYSDLIRRKFTFPEIRDEENLKWKEKIENCNSVSVHFRGGDYYKEGFAVLGEEYYRKAYQLLQKKEGELTFFIFTDDIENARNTLPNNKNTYYITNNRGTNSYIDMQLMSLCKHNIMANSTFSFWGAYLNGNEEKVVVGSKGKVGGNSLPYYFENVVLI